MRLIGLALLGALVAFSACDRVYKSIPDASGMLAATSGKDGSSAVNNNPAEALDGDPPYVPETLDVRVFYVLPSGHEWRVPVITSLDRQPDRPISDPLPWYYNLWEVFQKFVGKYLVYYFARYVDSFGLAIYDGPAYPSEIPPAGVQLIRYNDVGFRRCYPADRDPATPEPPTFSAAKLAADTYCQTLCGSPDFEMVDFDMNQWRYTCYKYGTKSYQIVTWGGTRCEKTLDNGMVQACYPLTGAVEIRRNLGNQAISCPACDKDGDGVVSLQDLILERNNIYRPTQGLGLTFARVVNTTQTVDQTMNLTQYVTPGSGLSNSAATYLEITHWQPGTPVDCKAPLGSPNHQLNWLPELTISDQTSHYLGQLLGNQYCQAQASNVCRTGALGMIFGHCRINRDGTHSIRATVYCMKCN